MKRRVTQLEVGPPEGRVASREFHKKFLLESENLQSWNLISYDLRF